MLKLFFNLPILHNLISSLYFWFFTHFQKESMLRWYTQEHLEKTTRLWYWGRHYDERIRFVPNYQQEDTAVFTSLRTPSPIRWYNILYYQWHIHRDFYTLLKKGYTNFVVNYGTPYGLLALFELNKLRAKELHYRLNCFKTAGETCDDLLEDFEVHFNCEICDINSRDLQPSIVQTQIYDRAGFISFETSSKIA